MLDVEEQTIDRMTETIYHILRGEKPSLIELPENYPENEMKQLVAYLNQFVAEYNEFSDFMYSIARGELDYVPPKGKMRVVQSFKSLQSNLRHLTWKTQQIANGDLDQRVDFMGDFSAAFNSMTQQLKNAFDKLDRANHFIRQTFGRYLSDEIVEAILETPEGMRIGGEKRRVTIMMADLREFTSISEAWPAEDVVNMLNSYLAVMTDIIVKYGGTINDFIGDAIVVIFGAPIQHEDDAKRGVACAIAMQLAMAVVNQRNETHGYPEITMGIGLNTGDVVVGNIGSHKRTKYDVVGQAVNLASRIESYTVGGQILISQNTLDACKSLLRIDDRMEVMPKGVKEPMNIYDIGGIGGEFNIFLPKKDMIVLIPLSAPPAIRFTILEGKHVHNRSYHGRIVKLNALFAEIEARRSCRPLSNLKLSVFDANGNEIATDLYAKVTRQTSDQPPCFRIRFNFLPAETVEFFDKLLNA